MQFSGISLVHKKHKGQATHIHNLFKFGVQYFSTYYAFTPKNVLRGTKKKQGIYSSYLF